MSNVMHFVFAMFWVWLLNAAFGVLLTLPIVFFSRNRVDWRRWELLAFVLPYVTWTILFFSDLSTGTKSLANLIEPFWVCPAIAVAASLRALVGKHLSSPIWPMSLLIALCFVAVSVFFVVPPLPE
jgi:hypothetical protein